MHRMNRREVLSAAGAATLALSTGTGLCRQILASPVTVPDIDPLPLQLYRSLSEDQRQRICLPADHPRRRFISNWWYIHRDYRVNNAFTPEQQELIQQIFDSLHAPEFREKVNRQVEIDQYGEPKNAPSVGFFGSPEEGDLEFIYTGHHVTRRCDALSPKGRGFGGNPIFYGHFPEDFHETSDHPGNPYWYQGRIFNQFVRELSGRQQQLGLVSGGHPRSEKPDAVIRRRESGWPGLPGSDLSADQKQLLLKTMRRMLVMFRPDDVEATMSVVEQNGFVDRLYVSWFDGKYDIGGDRVWDTWQIEGPDLVWYFRGQPHIHSYFHVAPQTVS